MITGNRNREVFVGLLESVGRAIVDTLPIYQTDFADVLEAKDRSNFIEKGADASLFATKKNHRSNLTLKFGMLAVGIGIGILIASLLESYTVLDEEVAYPSMIFLFGGVFLIANALIEKKDKIEENNKTKETKR